MAFCKFDNHGGNRSIVVHEIPEGQSEGKTDETLEKSVCELLFMMRARKQEQHAQAKKLGQLIG